VPTLSRLRAAAGRVGLRFLGDPTTGKAPGSDQIALLERGIQSPWGRRTRDLKAQLDYFTTSPPVRRSLHPAAQSVASARWYLYALRGSGESALAKALVSIPDRGERRRTLMEDLPADVEIVEVREHPFLDLLRHGAGDLSGPLMIYATEIARTLPGEAYWILEPNADLVPARAWYIPPHWIERMPTAAEPTYSVRLPRTGTALVLPANWVVRFMDPNPADPYDRGSGLGRVLADEVEADDQAAIQIRLFFEQGMKPEVLITGKGLTGPARRELEETWRDKLAGTFKRWQLHTLNVPDNARIHQLSQDFEGVGLVGLRQFYGTLIRELRSMPPEIVGEVQSSNRATSYTAAKRLREQVTTPACEYYRQVFQRRILPHYLSPRPLFVDYALPAIEDEDNQHDLRKAIPWAMSWGQIARLQGVEAPEGADTIHLLPVGVIARTEEQLLNPASAVPAVPPAPATPAASLKKKVRQLPRSLART
jgi:hypothetical protein